MQPKLWFYTFNWTQPGADGKPYKAGWARVTMSDRGDFSAITDWENLAYGWWAHGMGAPKDFRWFWLDMFDEVYYFVSKFTSKQELDLNQSVIAIREYLMNLRNFEKTIHRDGFELAQQVSKLGDRQALSSHPWYRDQRRHDYSGCHGYREEADLLKSLESGDISPDVWTHETHIPEGYELLVYRQPQSYTNMARGFLPALAEVIAAELEGEGHDVTEHRERLARWKASQIERAEEAV